MMLSSVGAIIGALVAIIGVFAAIIAAFVVMKNKQKLSKLPVQTVEAKFVGAETNTRYVNKSFSSETVDRFNSYKMTDYIIAFKPKQGKRISFKVIKKTGLMYNDGDMGALTYQGNKFIDFVVKNKNMASQPKSVKLGKTILFYGEAEDIGVSVMSNKRIDYNKADIEELIKRLRDDQSDWFFVLKRDDGAELQVEREGIDIKCTLQIASNQTVKTILYNDLLRYTINFFES